LKRSTTLSAAPWRVFGVVHGYFFRSGFRLQLGMARILLFSAVLWTILNQLVLFSPFGWPSDYLAAHVEFYPFGILQLFGDRPPLWLIDAAAVLAPLAALLAIVGLWTRPAMIASTMLALILVCVREGVDPYWSHGYNIVFYCAFPFMFARAAGTTLALDHLLWRRHARWKAGRPGAADGYAWPVVAGLLAACVFYYGAFWAKVTISGPLNWWNSDNMRFSLAVTWLGYDRVSVPWFIEQLWSRPWLYKAFAAAHIVMQLAPVAAVFSLRRPWARAIEGALFAGSVVGLGLIMGLWHLPWLLLVTFFVDWDYWLLRWRKSAAPAADPGMRAGLRAIGLVILVAYFAVIHAMFMLYQRRELKLYPLTPLTFYGSVRALPPYDQHRHFPGTRCEFTMTVPSCAAVGLPDRGPRSASLGVPLGREDWSCHSGEVRFRYFNITYAGYCARARTFAEQRAALEGARRLLAHLPVAASARMPWRYSVPVPPMVPDEIGMYSQRIQYPAWPASPDPIVVQEGLRAVLKSDGSIRSAIGKVTRRDAKGRTVFTVETTGFNQPEISLRYRADVVQKPGLQPEDTVPGHWEGSSFVVDTGSLRRPAFVTITVRERGEERDYVFADPEWIL